MHNDKTKFAILASNDSKQKIANWILNKLAQIIKSKRILLDMVSPISMRNAVTKATDPAMNSDTEYLARFGAILLRKRI